MEFLGLSLTDIGLRLVLGLIIGFCIGLTGVGGGVLGLQAMTLAIGLDPIRAVGTTSLYIFLTNISAVFHHAKLKTVQWGSASRILIGAIPANILVSSWISGQADNETFKAVLKDFIIGVVLFSILMMVVNMIKKSRTALEKEERTLASRINGHAVLRNVTGIGMGAIVGGLIGATSIGGGVLIVPMLVMVFGLTASQTVGTSVTIAMVLTLVTSLVYGRGGSVEHVTAVVMAAGSLGGVSFGSKLSVKMPEKILQITVVGLITFAVVMMILSR